MTQLTGVTSGGLYKFGGPYDEDEWVVVTSVSARVRVSKARGGSFYRICILRDDGILKLRACMLTFDDRGWILVGNDDGRRGPRVRPGERGCAIGYMLKAL